MICKVIQLYKQKKTNADLEYVKSDNATIKAMFRSKIERLSNYFKTFEENLSDKSKKSSSKSKKSSSKFKKFSDKSKKFIDQKSENLEKKSNVQSSSKISKKLKKQKIQKQKKNLDNTQNCMKIKIDSDLYNYDKKFKKIFSNEIITKKRHVDTNVSIKLLKHTRKFNNAFEQSMK